MTGIILEGTGILAMLLILSAYFLISSEKVDARTYIYHVLNFSGSVLFIIYLFIKGAWAALALNVAWAVIGIFALYSIFRSRTDIDKITEEVEKKGK